LWCKAQKKFAWWLTDGALKIKAASSLMNNRLEKTHDLNKLNFDLG
jgi:hypothetical protein